MCSGGPPTRRPFEPSGRRGRMPVSSAQVDRDHRTHPIDERDEIPWAEDEGAAPVGTRLADAFSSVQADLVRYLSAVVGREVAEDVASQVWVEVVGGAG